MAHTKLLCKLYPIFLWNYMVGCWLGYWTHQSFLVINRALCWLSHYNNYQQRDMFMLSKLFYDSKVQILNLFLYFTCVKLPCFDHEWSGCHMRCLLCEMLQEVFVTWCLCYTRSLIHKVFVTQGVCCTMSLLYDVFVTRCLCYTTSLLHDVFITQGLRYKRSLLHIFVTWHIYYATSLLHDLSVVL